MKEVINTKELEVRHHYNEIIGNGFEVFEYIEDDDTLVKIDENRFWEIYMEQGLVSLRRFDEDTGEDKFWHGLNIGYSDDEEEKKM